MSEERKAQELAQYLDAVLQGQTPMVAEAETVALGELGRSLAGVALEPRPAHRAAVERLVRQYRPTLRAGGSVPSWPVWLLASLVGALVIAGLVALSIALSGGGANPTSVLSPEVMVPVLTSGTAAAPGHTPTISLTVTSMPTTTRVPTASPIPAPAVAVTPTLATSSYITPTPTVTPTVTITPTSTVTPTVTLTPTVALTPTLTDTIVLTPPGRSGLAFHPEHLNAGGQCKGTYSASGSLKNHGPGLATGVEIGYQVVSGAQWVDRVEVAPSGWGELGTSKPGRFTVYVHTHGEWSSAGKGTQIVVRLNVPGSNTQATFTVKNQCTSEKEQQAEKPEKPDKPDKSKPEKPEKPKKPKKAK